MVAVPVPLVVDQIPAPTEGAVAANVAVVKLQIVCAAPAFEVTGEDEVMVTELFAEQAPLVTVH